MRVDEPFVNASCDHRGDLGAGGGWGEGVEPPVGEVANMWREAEAENAADCEETAGETTGIGVVLPVSV